VGRTIVFKERGVNLLKKFSEALSDYGKLEMEPKLEGKRMTIILAPAPAKSK
jgi:translation initiation factor IF-3